MVDTNPAQAGYGPQEMRQGTAILWDFFHGFQGSTLDIPSIFPAKPDDVKISDIHQRHHIWIFCEADFESCIHRRFCFRCTKLAIFVGFTYPILGKLYIMIYVVIGHWFIMFIQVMGSRISWLMPRLALHRAAVSSSLAAPEVWGFCVTWQQKRKCLWLPV